MFVHEVLGTSPQESFQRRIQGSLLQSHFSYRVYAARSEPRSPILKQTFNSIVQSADSTHKAI